MLSKEQSPEKCDATGFRSSNAGWPITVLNTKGLIKIQGIFFEPGNRN